jgi:hypothetical protein
MEKVFLPLKTKIAAWWIRKDRKNFWKIAS